MHLVYYALGVCIVNGWLLYRRHHQQNGTRIQYTMHLEYALLIDGCCIEDTAIKMVHAFSILCTWSMHLDVAVQKTLPPIGTFIQYIMHLEYALLIDGCCIENCHQNGTCIQYTMHLEYALLMDGCCIEDTATKMVHAFSILCTRSMHC